MRTPAMQVAVVVALLGGGTIPGAAFAQGRIHPGLDARLQRAGAAEQLTVVVRLREPGPHAGFTQRKGESRRAAVVQELRARSETGQAGIRDHLRREAAAGRVGRFEPLWIVNALSVSASPAAIRALAARADVESVSPDEIDVVPVGAPAEPNVAAVKAPALWSAGAYGQGTVVAVLDSGVDTSHPDLALRFRGGAGAWFDPYGQHATPYDRTGHGTWTAGVVVGGDAGGTSIGVAPQATFVAARIWNDAGSATATAIHRVFQWVLDPNGDGSGADAPDVVNGSWSYGSIGCNLEFQADLRALRAAGIVPVFAAGNFGPGSSTGASPANYPEALSVGAVDVGGAIAADSSRGPSACGGGTFPSVVAPGVNVVTTELFSLYTIVSGTSLAAPHVSGALALLLSAVPSASPAQAEAALLQTARDLGAAGPDDDFGRGMIDVEAALPVLTSAPPPPPVASPDAYTVPGGVASSIAAPGVLANDGSPSGAPLSALLASAPVHGAVALAANGGFTYTPAAGYAGTDAFSYVATDGTRQSAAATVTLTVEATAPTASGDSYAVAENGTLSVAAPGVLANDADPAGRALSALLVAAPANGTVTLQSNGAFTYVPRKNFYGADAFAYQASNGTTASATATVSITVTFVNQAPVAANDSASTRKGKSVTVNVLANDIDVDGTLVPSSVAIGSAPRNGTATRQANGTVVYAPKRTFTGTDSFTYTVQDDHGARSNAATVTVQVR
jgi:hypothetical protein